MRRDPAAPRPWPSSATRRARGTRRERAAWQNATVHRHGPEDGDRLEGDAHLRAVPRPARARHRAPRQQPAAPGKARRHLYMRRLWTAAVRVRDEVRERDRLAELLPP